MELICNYLFFRYIFNYSVFFLLSLVLCSTSFAISQPSLRDLLKNTNYSNTGMLYFKKDESNVSSISRVKLHFLKADDCYSGYLGGFNTNTDDLSFSINDGKLFSIDSIAVYRAAELAVSEYQIDQINSVLIRIVTNERIPKYDRFAWFRGSCQDQGINCCVPIVCSNIKKQCMLKYTMDTQPIIWY